MLPRTASGRLDVRQPAVPQDLDEVVEAFWQHHRREREPSRDCVERLARAALAADPDKAARATRLLFERVIEPLCDAFTESGARTYRRVFAQTIAIAREEQRCEPLHRALAAEGIHSEGDLLERVPELPLPTQGALDAVAREGIRRAFVLSRLTLGADVAITSVVLQRARQVFPDAQIRLVGTAASRAVAQSVAGIEVLEVPYHRSDDLAHRLNAWPVLRRELLTACAGSSPDEVVVIDTDSRLTQLGLLPPLRQSRSFQFPSRTCAAGDRSPLSVLVGQWLDDTFGAGPSYRPYLELTPQDETWSRALRTCIGGTEPLVCVSFGVGGNERKRAGIRFETDLVEWMVRQGCRVLLARGVGPYEIEQARRIARRLEARGVSVLHLPKGRGLPSLGGSARARVVTWEADVGAFLAAVACADFYIGYDSAGQHIAAALGVPTLSIFIECAGGRHADRWAPRGHAPVNVVRAAPPVNPVTLLHTAREAFSLLGRARQRGETGSPTGSDRQDVPV